MFAQIRTSSSARPMAERPGEFGDIRGWVNLTLNFRLKGYVPRQYLCTDR